MQKLKVNVLDLIEEVDLFSFEDGFLGSCGGTYYEGWYEKDIENIKDESELENLVLDEEWYEGWYDGDEDYNEFWNNNFKDLDGYFLIEDEIDLRNKGEKYCGKIIVDGKNKLIKIMVVPVNYKEFLSGEVEELIYYFDNEGKLKRNEGVKIENY